MRRVACRLGYPWQGTRATLLDREDLVTDDTARKFHELGWEVEVAVNDVFDWCRDAGTRGGEVFFANLFLHHFVTEKLDELLCAIAQRSQFFAAVEPRRSRLSLLFSRLVGLIGCNTVTRHDAPASVRAGFDGHELSRLWPAPGEWALCERVAGPFSHLFVAQKRK